MSNSTIEQPRGHGSIEALVKELQARIAGEAGMSSIISVMVGVVSIVYFFTILSKILSGRKIPMMGTRSIFEPYWLVGLRFSFNSKPMVQEGYEKHNKKGATFKVRRNDTEILVMPNKYVNELREMPEGKINSMKAHLKNLVARYTIGNTKIVLHSDLHKRTLQQKLTPALGNLVPSLKDELEYALTKEITECSKWTPVRVNDLVVRLVARISARVFVGPDLCRNDEWLYISIHFTKNLGWTRNLLRLFPSPFRGIAAYFMPSYWRIQQNVTAAQRLLGPIIRDRRHEAAHNPAWDEPNDFLQWMMNNARQDEGHPDDLAHRQLLVSLGAIHTTSMQVSHFMYDLCTYPEYIEDLRQEIISTIREDSGFKKTTLNKMRKLDSFLKESQRMNAPFTLSFQRVVEQPLTLKDGTHLSAGTHFAIAAASLAHDPDLLPGGGNPAEFDPFRYARLREDPKTPEALHRHQFATTDSNTLHFGHGKFACPGRFFASNEIKLILSHLLLMYDFRWADGASRPANLCFEEASYPDPAGKVVMRRRIIPEPDIAALIMGVS